jgi:hypothetical protein
MVLLTKVSKVTFYDLSDNAFDVTGIQAVEYNDSDPWIKINIPYGKLKHQHIKPSTIELKIACYDFSSMYNALVNTNAYNFATMVRNELGRVVVSATDDTGIEQKLQFSYVHVETIDHKGLLQDVNEAVQTVNLHADSGPIVVPY